MQRVKFLSLVIGFGFVGHRDDQVLALTVGRYDRNGLNQKVPVINMDGRIPLLAGRDCRRDRAWLRAQDNRLAEGLVKIKADQLGFSKPVGQPCVSSNDVALAIQQRDAVGHPF